MDPLVGIALVPVAMLAIVGLVRAARGTCHPDEEPETDGRELTARHGPHSL